MAKKPSIGRQKIKIAKIEIKNHLQVTFSKRRSGLFKKASELCTLCGVEIAIIVFSPAGKAFSFGYPNVDSITKRFLTRITSPNHKLYHLAEGHKDVNLRDLNLQLDQMYNELEAERKKGDSLENACKTSQNHYWWEGPVSNLGSNELVQLRDAMEELKKNVIDHAHKLMSNMANQSLCSLGSTGEGVIDHFDNKPTRDFASSNALPSINLGFSNEFL